MKTRFILTLAAGLSLFQSALAADSKEVQILNVSYDVTREYYQKINPLFVEFWKKKTGENVTVNQSHAGSSKQARAVLDGLEADVVTLNQDNDIDVLVDKGGLVPSDWKKKFPNQSAPYTSTVVFLVRKGNPKKIKEWEDLAKSGTAVIIPNPKTSGNGRYTYLAAWGDAVQKGGDEKKARALVGSIFKNVPVLDAGGRAATSTFVQKGIGDVLVTFENEIYLILGESGGDAFEAVYPPVSILAEPPVAVVDKVAEKKGTAKIAKAYLEFLYSDAAQEVAAQLHYRPRAEKVFKKYEKSFPKIKLFSLESVFGSWKEAQKIHFNDGGVYDQVYQPQGK